VTALLSILLGLSPAAVAGDDTFLGEVLPVLEEHCVHCHAEPDPAGQLDLERFTDAAAARDEPRTWARVRAALAEGAMPPESVRRRPAPDELAAVLGWIEATFQDLSTPQAAPPGRTTLRRLNRAEYRWAVLDLFGVDYPTDEHFPADGVSLGFDVIGETLSLAPVQLERLLAAAEHVAERALPTSPTEQVPVQRFEPGDFEAAEHHKVLRSRSLFAMYANGKSTIPCTVERGGEYLLRATATAKQAGRHPARLVLSVDRKRLGRLDVEAVFPEPEDYEMRLELDPGEHELGLAFINDFKDEEREESEGRDRNLYVASVELVGPLDALEATPFQQRFFPSTMEDELGAARRALARLAPLVWRRPVDVAELDELLALAPEVASERERLRTALVALLVSPHFLFRVEPEPVAGERSLTGHELATRLAAFLWSSVPDEELLARAAEGGLRDSAGLRKEVRRMLRDARASRLAQGFASGWLQLERQETSRPDPARFPRFDSGLWRAMRQETELFFEALLRESRPVSELLGSDFTFANERLAEHYGLDGVRGTHMRRVAVPAHLRARRGGLLGQAAVLTATSHATRTSPVLRGKWVLEVLLATPPPPPPPGVDALEDDGDATPHTSLRERLLRHREDPACAVCHAPMDGLGFALENYDATGAWRESDGDFPVDALAELPGEEPFEGPGGLRALLLRDGALLGGLARHLATYALGRALATGDREQLTRLLRDLPPDPTLEELVAAVCELSAFRTRRAETPGVEVIEAAAPSRR